MPKKVVITIILGILALIAGSLLFVSRQAKPPVIISRKDPPKISFDEETHNLGNITPNIEIPYDFKIHNIGGSPLIIKNVTANCHCLVLNLKDKYIQPGETGDLEVILNTTQQNGSLKQAISIFSNDPKVPKTNVFIAASIFPQPQAPDNSIDNTLSPASAAHPPAN